MNAIEQAIWAGDLDTLHELAPCICCCGEHTFENCPAREWSGCCGSGSMTRAELRSWVKHYADQHGMTEEEFFR